MDDGTGTDNLFAPRYVYGYDIYGNLRTITDPKLRATHDSRAGR